ncbi:MAG: plasmid pRiA4b ORF-3 family protein [Paramuribaculum sp.]|nr:plasmid pRiA4b ORF-3 family protein [Paramuribaculum sp.]
MIYRFRIVSDEVDNFKREISIDADATFLDLRNAICDSVNYDKGQMNSFFLCDEGWEKGREITLEDMGSDISDDVYLMDECVLGDYLEDEGQRLIFVFDYLTDRSFFIELKKTEPGKTLKDPVCTVAMGNPPAQFVDLDDFEAKIDAKAAKAAQATDIDEDFYGSEEFNDDEFDTAGFDEMSFDENM